MNNCTLWFCTLLFATCISACNNAPEASTSEDLTKSDTVVKQLIVEGNYVNNDYLKRSEGYDWIAVKVKQITDSTIHVAIRSRIDQKKPTCTFDADAVKSASHQYTAIIDGKQLLFVFSSDSVFIVPSVAADEAAFQYYCSGGGSFLGGYKKWNEPLDQDQIDPRVFVKSLQHNDYFADVSTTGEGSLQQLSLQLYHMGKEINSKKIELDGTVVNAEMGDLNVDGLPEIYVYTNSAGSGSYGNVVAYQWTKQKRLSTVTLPDITTNEKAKDGYMGHDQFAIVENTLVRRFKTYQQGDKNSTPTGIYRQIQYKLVMDKLVIDKIVEFPSN